jgi:hypothetical protein
VLQRYKDEAERRKAEHKLKYPNYRYQPKRGPKTKGQRGQAKNQAKPNGKGQGQERAAKRQRTNNGVPPVAVQSPRPVAARNRRQQQAPLFPPPAFPAPVQPSPALNVSESRNPSSFTRQF